MTRDPSGVRSSRERPLLTGTHRGGRLPRLDREGLRIADAHLVGVDATGIGPAGGRLTITGSVLEDCDFSGVDLSNAILSDPSPPGRVTYRRCRFAGTRFVPARLFRARFEECLFADVGMDGLHLHHSDLVGNTFTGSLRDLSMWGAPPAAPARWFPVQHPNLVVDNDFSSAQLPGLALHRGVDVRAQRWPDRPDRVIVDRLPERLRIALVGAEAAPPTVRRMLARHARDDLQAGYVFFLDDPSWSEHHRDYVDRVVGALPLPDPAP